MKYDFFSIESRKWQYTDVKPFALYGHTLPDRIHHYLSTHDTWEGAGAAMKERIQQLGKCRILSDTAMRCGHCHETISSGEPYKVVSVSIETHTGTLATVKEPLGHQTYCMTCELDSCLIAPKYGLDKPKGMDDWSAEKTARVLCFEFIEIRRELGLRTKLAKINVLNHWWNCLTGAQQHIVAKAYQNLLC